MFGPVELIWVTFFDGVTIIYIRNNLPNIMLNIEEKVLPELCTKNILSNYLTQKDVVSIKCCLKELLEIFNHSNTTQ